MSQYHAFNFLYALLIFGSLAYVSHFVSDESKNRLKVFIYLVKLIPTTVIAISSLLSRLFFTLTAHSLVLFGNSHRMLTQALQSGLQLLAESIKSFAVYLLQLFWEVLSVLVSAALDILKEAGSNACETFVEAMKGLAEKGKEGVEALSEAVKEVVVKSMVEMATQVVSDLWSNFMEALSNAQEQGE